MFKVKLEMDGLERWLTSLHYEYFCPVSINENKYRQFLKKNFPYEPSDAYIYQSNKHLPLIKHSLLDEKIESECRKNLDRAMQTYKLESTLDSMIDPFEINDQKNAYYCTLAKTRHNAGLDRYLVPNFTHNYDKYIRPSENISAPITYNRIGGVFSLVFNSSESDEYY